jgi:hypothetical protein
MLILGTEKTDTILEHLPESYLLIDDGPVIDALTPPKRRKVTHLDFTKHSFNPLDRMDYHKARQFIAILDTVFPEGASTLTKKNANFILLNALLARSWNKTRTRYLDSLIAPPDKEDTGAVDAYQKIQTLLLSPVLLRFLCSPTDRFSFRGILVARLDRAAMGDFDTFVLGNLLIGNYPGTVVIPDFGFYAMTSHIQLMRQKRLMPGVNFLDEVPPVVKRNLLLMDTKVACHTTFEDAECLAGYAGLIRGTNRYNDFIEDCVGNKP